MIPGRPLPDDSYALQALFQDASKVEICLEAELRLIRAEERGARGTEEFQRLMAERDALWTADPVWGAVFDYVDWPFDLPEGCTEVNDSSREAIVEQARVEADRLRGEEMRRCRLAGLPIPPFSDTYRDLHLTPVRMLKREILLKSGEFSGVSRTPVTGTDESRSKATAEMPAPAKKLKEPPPGAFDAYRLCKLMGQKQEVVARQLAKKYRAPFSQSKVVVCQPKWHIG
jgi:hypothetical protein